jgi:hypothetical protein
MAMNKGILLFGLTLCLTRAHVSLLFPKPEYVQYQVNGGDSVLLESDQLKFMVVEQNTAQSPVIQAAIKRFPNRFFPDRVPPVSL